MPPRSAALVFSKARDLFDPSRAIDEVGDALPEIRAGAQDVNDRNFRVEPRAGRDHGELLEIRIDMLPVDFLLR